MEIRDLDKSTMNMIPENIFMESDTVLVQYIIKSWTLQLRNTSNIWILQYSHLKLKFLGDTNQGIELVLVLKRRIINEILTTYLPSILILSIVYATNFFKAFFFESIISTNLTSQLVLTTLFISVSQSLPPTAYVKMIDVWLIFSQLIPWVEVIEIENLLHISSAFTY